MLPDIHIFESVVSTMDIARDMAAEGAPEWTVVQADMQTGGRGRRGNAWISPKGNLYQSIILRPIEDKQSWGQLSFVIAVALAKAAAFIGIPSQDIALKWPNDVLVKGRKLAGILIEARDDCLILGTGVNVAHAPDDRSKISDYNAAITVDDFRDIFLDYIMDYYYLWEIEGFTSIRTTWIACAYKIGETIQARLADRVHEGVFEDLDEQGILLLREKDGFLRKIHSGEIICS